MEHKVKLRIKNKQSINKINKSNNMKIISQSLSLQNNHPPKHNLSKTKQNKSKSFKNKFNKSNQKKFS